MSFVYDIWTCNKRKQKYKSILVEFRRGQDESSTWDSYISRQAAHEVGKFVSPTHRPPLAPGNIPGLLEAQSIPRP